MQNVNKYSGPIAFVLITGLFIFLLLFALNSGGSVESRNDYSSNQSQDSQDLNSNENNMYNNDVADAPELKVEILQEGSGETIKDGDKVSVHYTGTLLDGTKFDSSLDRGEPFQFTMGAGGLIEGWIRGVEGMSVGEKRKITIPSELGYGEFGSPPVIPGGAGLIFEIEVLEIVN